MDLSGNQTVVTLYEIDDETGLITVTFKDSTETTTFGTLTIEKQRFRSLLDAVGEVGKFYFVEADTENREGHRTAFSRDSARATTVFG